MTYQRTAAALTGRRRARVLALVTLTALFAGGAVLYFLWAASQGPVDGAGSGFLGSITPPIWIVLLLNLATLLTALANAYAALSVTPDTTLEVAERQATTAREAIEVARLSAQAAGQSSSASMVNAGAAARSTENTGIHAVARLRQEWINDVRSSVARAHALLVNWRPAPRGASPETQAEHHARVIEASQVVTHIELLLNPLEVPSQELLTAVRALEDADAVTNRRKDLGRALVAATQEVLKAEWNRVKGELEGRKNGAAEAAAKAEERQE